MLEADELDGWQFTTDLVGRQASVSAPGAATADDVAVPPAGNSGKTPAAADTDTLEPSSSPRQPNQAGLHCGFTALPVGPGTLTERYNYFERMWHRACLASSLLAWCCATVAKRQARSRNALATAVWRHALHCQGTACFTGRQWSNQLTFHLCVLPVICSVRCLRC